MLPREHRAAFHRLSDRPNDDAKERSFRYPDGMEVGVTGAGDLETDPDGGRGAEGETFRATRFPPRPL